MTLYIVRDERRSEVAAYAVYELAKRFADFFQSATLREYSVEKIEVDAQ